MLKATLRHAGISLAFVFMLALSACGANGSVSEMTFSFNTSTPADSYDVKSIFVNEDTPSLTLNGNLKMDAGEVTVSVVDAASGDQQSAIWSDNFKEDTSFDIVLSDLKKNNEYLVTVEALQSKAVTLTVASDAKLARDKAKPETD